MRSPTEKSKAGGRDEEGVGQGRSPEVVPEGREQQPLWLLVVQEGMGRDSDSKPALGL